MSILIKGMDLPTEGLVTVNIHSDGTVYVHGAYPTELHKAVSVPTQHGPLIDTDEFRKAVEDLPNCYNGFSDTYDKACIIGLIDETPPIIEADKE